MPRGRAGKLSARPPKNVVVDAEFVKSVQQRPNHMLVDARAPVFYTGIQPTMNDKSGHIPGAVNIPFTQITDNELLIDRARVEALFRKAGVKPGDTVVVYCHVGQQATAVVFARAAARPPVRALRRRVPGLGGQQPGSRWRSESKVRRGRTPIRTWPASASGLVLLAAYVVVGQGLGASGAFASVVAAGTAAVQGTTRAVMLAGGRALSAARHREPAARLAGARARWASSLGGFASAWLAGRLRRDTERGARRQRRRSGCSPRSAAAC